MPNILYANNASGTLSAGITNASTTLTLTAAPTAFPTPVPPQVFYVTLTDAATQTLIEIVKVTAVSGNVFSIVRAQDGTSALSWNAGDIVSQRSIRLEMQGWENAAEGLFNSPAVAITPSTTLGIVGTTTNDNANAGAIGEFQSNSPTGFPLASTVPASVAQIVSLSAGDWDITGTCLFLSSGVGALATMQVSLSPSTSPNATLGSTTVLQSNFITNVPQAISAPVFRVSQATAGPWQLVVTAAFTGGSMSATGLIRARRVR